MIWLTCFLIESPNKESLYCIQKRCSGLVVPFRLPSTCNPLYFSLKGTLQNRSHPPEVYTPECIPEISKQRGGWPKKSFSPSPNRLPKGSPYQNITSPRHESFHGSNFFKTRRPFSRGSKDLRTRVGLQRENSSYSEPILRIDDKTRRKVFLGREGESRRTERDGDRKSSGRIAHNMFRWSRLRRARERWKGVCTLSFLAAQCVVF